MKLIIVSGLSGSGKSVALNTLEDEGYYCVDNLPLNLLPQFLRELQLNTQNFYDRAAVGIDARANLEEIQNFPQMLKDLKSRSIDIEVVFLYASQEVLLKRFSETRRKHPLTRFNHPLVEAIQYESDVLATIEPFAALSIDTSDKTANDLKQIFLEHYSGVEGASQDKLALLFQSFGFKHGLPSDTSFVFDVRCLPNPHWEPELRPLNGRDEAVKVFLESQPSVVEMEQSICEFIERWIPDYERENRRYLTVSIGCTGGQHRSVYLVERLTRHFKSMRNNVALRHRELA
ncbi:MAG: RNase adapter RapZ [Pseudomonadota bacterium]